MSRSRLKTRFFNLKHWVLSYNVTFALYVDSFTPTTLLNDRVILRGLRLEAYHFQTQTYLFSHRKAYNHFIAMIACPRFIATFPCVSSSQVIALGQNDEERELSVQR